MIGFLIQFHLCFQSDINGRDGNINFCDLQFIAGGGEGGDPWEPWNIKVSLFSIFAAFHEHKSTTKTSNKNNKPIKNQTEFDMLGNIGNITDN
jgi:hypothetical protein